MQPDDILAIRWVSDPQPAPDASKVAYVVTMLDARTNENRSHVHIVDAASGESRQLTNGPKRDTTPRWSPDGRHLAFVSERGDEKAQIWVIDSDGGEAWRLTDTPDPAANPAWSPDGRRVAFTSRLQSEPPPKGPDGKPFQKIRKITTMKYKSNGEGIIDDLHAQVFVVEADLTKREHAAATQLTRGDFSHGAPAWSPDGRQVAFSAARHPGRDRDGASDIWVLDVPEAGTRRAAGAPRKVTQTRGPALSPSWSPDGREIAYVGHTDRRAGVTRHNKLWKVAAAGGEPVCLTPDLDRNCVNEAAPVWSADGRSVACLVVDAGNTHLYQVAASGDGAPRVALGGLRTVSAAHGAGGRVVFTASDATHPTEVLIADEDGSKERVLTAENAAWLESVDLAEPEVLKVVSADGTPVQAWVIRPRGARGPVPCLLNVHGGPKSQYANTFHDEFQVYAGAGYAVVYGNPRGSDGQTEAFATTVRGAWGDKDWADVTAIADAIEGLGFVDQERVGIMGGSYGGFMTSWAVGHTNRFRAACSERAVNNIHSMVGTSDIGSWFMVQHTGKPPYDDIEPYLRMSPLTYAGQIETPLLILHSENDLRCPIEQGEQLYIALKLRNKPVEFWRFPEDNHEMSRSGKPLNRLKRFEVILEWFGRWMPKKQR
jgi:dipeptidyl aminopeptidase/acylaminoacyl peptidase